MAALKMAGAQVDIISLRNGSIRGVNLHKPASRVRVTKTVKKANPDRYDGLLIPGGFINPDLLRQSQEAREFARGIRPGKKAHRQPMPRALAARIGRPAQRANSDELAGHSCRSAAQPRVWHSNRSRSARA